MGLKMKPQAFVPWMPDLTPIQDIMLESRTAQDQLPTLKNVHIVYSVQICVLETLKHSCFFLLNSQ